MAGHKFSAAQVYRNVGLETRGAIHDQHELVKMMFETILENLRRARGAIEQQNIEVKIESITKAIRIIHEGLRTSLDLENGGELAANLANLYDYCTIRLAQANATNDTVKLTEVSALLEQIADAWQQMRPQADASASTTEAQRPAAKPAGKGTIRSMVSLYGLGGSPQAAVLLGT